MTRLSLLYLSVLALSLGLVGHLPAQDLTPEEFEQQLEMARELGQGLPEGAIEPDRKVTIEARYIVDEGGRTGTLEIIAKVIPHWHIFSVTQKPGPALPTKIRLASGFTDAEITGSFQPDSDPTPVDYGDDVPGEEHHGTITWSAPIEFAEGVDPQSLSIPVKLTGQVCEDGMGSCIPLNENLTATVATAATRFVGEYAPDGAHATIRGWVDKTHAQPGGDLTLSIQLEPGQGVFVFDHAEQPTPTTTPTLVVLTKRNNATMSLPAASAESEQIQVGEETVDIHRQPVMWEFPIELPRDIEEGKQRFSGLVGFQADSDGAAGAPQAVQFNFDLIIGSATVEAKNELAFFTPDDADYGKVATAAQEEYERNRQQAGAFAGMSIPAVLGLAFIAGLILNIMPCVLPVIGLKVLSFVQQAGENPRRVLMLNLVFAAGIIFVFMLLATLATFPQLLFWGSERVGWGGLFESQAFTIVMVAVVFAFGLSFLGVWEIPIPGFAASAGVGKAEQEGYMGAFTKGILTTLLATPCSGPLLIPAVTWAFAQPPAVTYLVFLALGVGMAFPYIVIGFKPSLVSWLPKPGPWMETFKQLMGFILMATAVFFFNSIIDKFEIPTLVFLVFVGLACWLAGRISLTMDSPVRIRKWATALAVVGLGGFISYYAMIPQNELDWQPFTRQFVDDTVAEGNIVFVDFTADW